MNITNEEEEEEEEPVTVVQNIGPEATGYSTHEVH